MMNDEVVGRNLVAPANLRRVSWGAIIAGVILTLIVQVMLGLLGFGVGLASLDPAGSDNPTVESFSSASGLWTLGTVLVATFVGGYAAARLAGSASKRDGALHGIVTWATATLVAVYLLTSGVSAVLTGAFGALGGTIQSIGRAAGALTPDSLGVLPPELQAQARQLLDRGAQQAGDAAGAVQQQAGEAAQAAQQATGEEDLTAAVSEILSGLGENATPEQRQAAVNVISSQANIPAAEAEQRLQQFQATYDQAIATARQTAAQAAAALSTTAFIAFVVLLLGLVVGALGGIVGKPARVVGYYRD